MSILFELSQHGHLARFITGRMPAPHLQPA